MTWSAGDVLTAGELNTYLPQSWTSWTPTITGGTLQAGTQGYYIRSGKTVHATFAAKTATTTGAAFVISLPVAPARAPVTVLPIGTAWALTAGLWYNALVGLPTTGADSVSLHPHAEGDAWGHVNSVPAAWDVGAEISFSVTYEAA